MENLEDKIKELLDKMTLEEKIGQLQQTGASLAGAFQVDFEELLNMLYDGRMTEAEFGAMMGGAEQDYKEDDLRSGKIGSYGGSMSAEKAMELQRIAVEESRLGIPNMICCDVVHGYKTITPTPLAESCAWDTKLWEKTARVAAKEASAAGINMTFSPMVDVSKDARWGRIAESAGEDVLINSAYGVAKVQGYQTDNPKAHDAIAACVKHIAAYGAVESGRDYNRVDMSTQKLYEEYLPPYEACIKAGALAIMPSFNDINGIPNTANETLLKDILRADWKFKGVTISDSNAVAELINHGYAKDEKDAAMKAIQAGVDVDMTSNCFIENLKELIDEGTLQQDTLDKAVTNVLRVKFELGLFDDPYQTSVAREAEEILSEENRSIALEAAQKSIVLLKNENILPLKKNKKVGVIGELAKSRNDMLGCWAISADEDQCVSVVDALEMKQIPYEYFETADEAAKSDCETILTAIGETKKESGEASSKVNISLSEKDILSMKVLKDAGKEVTVLLFNGRPMAIQWCKENMPAIVECWQLGTEAGTAIVDVLYGDINPSGKLTTTFPYSAGQCPVYYDHMATGRPGGKSRFTSKYIDAPIKPVYPFGYGISYTIYEYKDISCQVTDDEVQVAVTVVNAGECAGEEIVQCYFQDPVAKRIRPVKKLVAFERIALKAGEQKVVKFNVKKSLLGYYDQKMNYIVDDGEIIMMVGGNSEDVLERSIEIVTKG